MTVPLLVLLLVACVLWAAFGFGRSMWARARSVKRHRQALETLADLTAGRELNDAPGAEMRPGAEGRHLRGDYQAHVRLFGPAGEPLPRELPPPRPLARPAPSASRFRRPSRAPAREDATVPGRSLPPSPGPPVPRPELPTRPVPVVRPHVYYFDDLSPWQARGEEARGKAARAAEPAAAEARAAEAHPGTARPAPSPPPPPATGGRWTNPDKLRWLGIAAAVVAIVLAAVAVATNLPPSSPGQRAAPTTAPHSARTSRQARSKSPARPATSTNDQTAPTTTATTAPPKPAQLLSAGGGTATYQLRSKDALVVVKASGPCWIEVRVGSPAGQVVYEGTLEAGMMAHVTGPAWIRLGNPPAVTVLVDGTPMPVPGRQAAVPMNLEFTLG